MSTKDTVLITGASTGIGAVYADRFAKRGHNLILVARDFQKLEDVANRLWDKYDVNVAIEVADLTHRPDLERIEQLFSRDSHIGILVNNAGAGTLKPIVGSTADDFEALMNLNVTAATRLAIVAANAFVARGGGSIINVSSVLALAPESKLNNAVYGGSKAFMLAFSQSLTTEAGERGLYVQAVLPGITRTEILPRMGIGYEGIDPNMVMEAGDLVDAALAGYDARELVTIPSLPDAADWQAVETARQKLGPNLSHRLPAGRYRVKLAERAA